MPNHSYAKWAIHNLCLQVYWDGKKWGKIVNAFLYQNSKETLSCLKFKKKW